MKKFAIIVSAAMGVALGVQAASTFSVDASNPRTVSPRFYGLMTEEINHAYDGGLYAELIRNRAFLDDAAKPEFWTAVSDGASIALETKDSFNDKLTNSLRLTVAKASKDKPAGVANAGYWGIPVQPDTTYRAWFLAKTESGFAGPVTVSIVSQDGQTNYASATIASLKPGWNRYDAKLKTGKVQPTANTRFQITLDQPGALSLGMVSLFPPTWNDRPNGLRKDLMQMLVDMNPKFLRFPGGNYVEGDTIETRFDWKKTIGPVEERPGHLCPWSYRSSDGLGLLEFLEWAEDMKSEGVLAVYAGYSLKGAYVKAGPDLEPYVKDALDEIEYAVGGANTTWGARRAKDGHPAPFVVNYIEVGNEDFFDKSKSYDGRFAQFYDAIKAKYPKLKIISTIAADQPKDLLVSSRKPDMLDEHYYLSTEDFLKKSPSYASNYDRSGAEIFVGEWAAHEDGAIKPWSPGARLQPPTPAMKAALGDAAFMAAMERNSDVIQMQCYAPLFVNVNPGARQWRPDLIGYDALTSYGSPSYYALKMFGGNLGDQILAVAATETSVQGCATRDSKTGAIIVKLVNPLAEPQPLVIDFKGAGSINSTATAITLAAKPEDSNTITEPRKVAPVTTTIRDVKPGFTFTMPPDSVVVLKFTR